MSQADHSFLSGLTMQPLHSSATAALSTKAAHTDKELQRRVVKYEKEFNINVSRLEQKEKCLKNSMMAYTERMNNIKTKRTDLSLNQSDLQVRAKRIPKKKVLPKLELNEVGTNVGKPFVGPRRHSLKPITSSRTIPPKDGVKLNFVDASDLCDLIQKTRVLQTKSIPVSHTLKSNLKETEPRVTDGNPGKNKSKGGVCVAEIKVDVDSDSRSVSNSSTSERLTDHTSVVKTKSGINFRSEETLKLVQNALQRLQEIEIKRKHTRSMLHIPRNNRTKRLTFPESDLSAIPEDGAAESTESNDTDNCYVDKRNFLRPDPWVLNSPRSPRSFALGLSDIPEVDNSSKTLGKSKGAFKGLPPIPVSQANQERPKTDKYAKERRKRLRNHSE